jgi:quinol monooxygenase YgiN
MRRLLVLFFSTIVLGVQAPADTTFYAVTYVELMPASKPAAVTAFRQYRETSRKEEGFGRLEFFEQAGRPAHFTLIETWSNPKAFDAHAAAAHTKEWRSKMDTMRTSDYDQRPYKAIATASASTAGERAAYVISHVDIGGGGATVNAADMLRKLAEASRKEAGNLRFDVLQHAMRANHFTVIEVWQDQKALDAHAAAAHTRQHRDALGPFFGSPLDERIYTVVEPGRN